MQQLTEAYYWSPTENIPKQSVSPGGRAHHPKAAEEAAPVLKFNNEISGKSEKDGSLVF